MKFILLLTLCVMHLSQVMSKPANETNGNPDRAIVSPACEFGGNQNETMAHILNELTKDGGLNIVNMNTDCLFTIFRKLNTTELIELSKISQFIPAIELVLKSRMKKLSIVIGGVRNHNNYKSQRLGKFIFDDIYEFSGGISIQQFPTAVAILNNLGHIIEQLEIDDFRGWTVDSTKYVLKLINLHCSERVKSITFRKTEINIFNELTTPFKMAEHVTWFTDLGESHFNFSKMFPMVRSMHIRSYNISNVNARNFVLPQLEYVHSEFMPNTTRNLYKTLFGGLLTSNPHITNITLHWYSNKKVVKFVSDELPNLKDLKIYAHDHKYDGEITNVRFDKLKQLTILGENPSFPKFACENVEELLLTSRIKPTDVIDILQLLPHLKTFEYYGRLYNSQIDSLVSMEWNATEAIFVCSQDITPQNIVRLIQSSRNLQKLNLRSELGVPLAQFLPALVNVDEWTVRRDDYSKSIFLQKENQTISQNNN